jgi:hypothetical protein
MPLDRAEGIIPPVVDATRTDDSQTSSMDAERLSAWAAVAVKVWSDMLGEAIWVVADDLPGDEWPTDAPVYTHAEVKQLLQVCPNTLAWVHATKQIFGAQVVDGGTRSRRNATE